MKGRREAFAELAALGATRWDTNPPIDGKIRWFNKDFCQIAEAEYAVILSVGPGARYTMGWAIPIYSTAGIPFVPDQGDGPSVVDVTSDDQVWARAEAVGRAIGADFVYACGTLLIAVHGFKAHPGA